MGQGLSADIEAMGKQMGRHKHDIRLSAGHPEYNIHDEHHRIAEHVAKENNTQPTYLPQRRISAENCYTGYTGGLKEMDASDQKLGQGNGLFQPQIPRDRSIYQIITTTDWEAKHTLSDRLSL